MRRSNQPLGLDKILNMALTKEKNSHQFYSNILMEGHPEFVRGLLERLKDEEYKHIRMVEAMIAKLRMGKEIV